MAFDLSSLDPVALQIGPVAIRWYALAYLAGILIGWRYVVSLAGSMRPNKDDIDDFVSWAIIGIIVGGRIGYVLFYNWDYYAAHPGEAFKIWQGGMSFHGGMLGVFTVMVGYSRLKGFSFLRLADLVTAAAPIGLFFGRIANFINGELYGRVTDGPWGIVFPHAGPQPRHPSQLYEAVLEGLVLFIILHICIRSRLSRHYGFGAGLFLAGYGTFRALVETVRQPDAQLGLLSFGLSMGQILSLPMIAVGLAVMAWALRNSPAKQEP